MSDFEEAEWGIPDCKYERTPDGFSVEIESMRPNSPARMLFHIFNGLVITFSLIGFAIYLGFQTESFGVGIIGFLVAFVGGIAITARLTVKKLTTKIVVTRDAILIGGKKLRRSDFIHFNIDHTVDLPGAGLTPGVKVAVMGYGYGSRKFEFGGQCEASAATRIVSSLNTRLRYLPKEGDERSPSPEALRAARPTDF